MIEVQNPSHFTLNEVVDKLGACHEIGIFCNVQVKISHISSYNHANTNPKATS
jgi:hypothetical protein